MLTFDKLKNDFYDPKLGIFKIGVLLARKHPDKIDDFINCRSLKEVSEIVDIPGKETFYETGIKLLGEWLKDKGKEFL